MTSIEMRRLHGGTPKTDDMFSYKSRAAAASL